MSDIHLEYSKNGPKYINKLKPDCKKDEILVLAGDIGNPTTNLYKLFIQTMSKFYEHIVIVSGNHEYYQNKYNKYGSNLKKIGSSMESIDQMLYEIANNYDNVHYLQKNELIIDDVRFLGCTMWTNPNPSLTDEMNDYFIIPDMTAKLCKELHEDHKAWLKEKLKNNAQFKKNIVITHHCPSILLLEKSTIWNI